MLGAQIKASGTQVIDGYYVGADSIGAMADYVLAHAPAGLALTRYSMSARAALEV